MSEMSEMSEISEISEISSEENSDELVETESTSRPIRQQPTSPDNTEGVSPQYFLNREAPPSYFESQNELRHNPSSGVDLVIQEEDLLTRIFQHLDTFFIIKSDTPSSDLYAVDADKQQLFTYVENGIEIDDDLETYGILQFMDNNGGEFLRGEMSRTCTKVISGREELGILDPIPEGDQAYFYSGKDGDDIIDFRIKRRGQESKVGDDGCRILSFSCCSFVQFTQSYEYEILINRQFVGRFATNNSEGTVVEFKEELDVRFKALIVVGVFILHNFNMSTT